MTDAGRSTDASGTDGGLILFVCSGNICRSPFAAAAARGLLGDAAHEVASAGTLMTSGHRSPDDAIIAAAEFGHDLTNHRSRPASADLLAGAERIYSMDRTHVAFLARSGFESELLDPAGGEIADPYGRGLDAYRRSYQAITKALDDRFGPAGQRP